MDCRKKAQLILRVAPILTVAGYMDDELRELLHGCSEINSDEDFLYEYLLRAKSDDVVLDVYKEFINGLD